MKRLYVEYYLIVFAFLFGFTWFVYPQLPEVMVTHWGLYGQANGWMHRSMGAWLLPIILGLLWLVWEIRGTTPDLRNESWVFYQPYRLMGLFMFIFLGVIQIMMLGVNLGWQIDMLKVVSWLLVVFLAVLGQLLPEMPRNTVVGIRTPWSMKNNAVWRKTHLETARWCRGVSLIDIVVLIVLSPPVGFGVVIGSFVGCMLWGVVLSYIYRRINSYS